MKHVYWKIKSRGAGYYFIEYWTKKDKSNAITTKMVTIEESKIRRNIADETGLQEFSMEQVKDKGHQR